MGCCRRWTNGHRWMVCIITRGTTFCSIGGSNHHLRVVYLSARHQPCQYDPCCKPSKWEKMPPIVCCNLLSFCGGCEKYGEILKARDQKVITWRTHVTQGRKSFDARRWHLFLKMKVTVFCLQLWFSTLPSDPKLEKYLTAPRSPNGLVNCSRSPLKAVSSHQRQINGTRT